MRIPLSHAQLLRVGSLEVMANDRLKYVQEISSETKTFSLCHACIFMGEVNKLLELFTM